MSTAEVVTEVVKRDGDGSSSQEVIIAATVLAAENTRLIEMEEVEMDDYDGSRQSCDLDKAVSLISDGREEEDKMDEEDVSVDTEEEECCDHHLSSTEVVDKISDSDGREEETKMDEGEVEDFDEINNEREEEKQIDENDIDTEEEDRCDGLSPTVVDKIIDENQEEEKKMDEDDVDETDEEESSGNLLSSVVDKKSDDLQEEKKMDEDDDDDIYEERCDRLKPTVVDDSQEDKKMDEDDVDNISDKEICVSLSIKTVDEITEVKKMDQDDIKDEKSCAPLSSAVIVDKLLSDEELVLVGVKKMDEDADEVASTLDVSIEFIHHDECEFQLKNFEERLSLLCTLDMVKGQVIAIKMADAKSKRKGRKPSLFDIREANKEIHPAVEEYLHSQIVCMNNMKEHFLSQCGCFEDKEMYLKSLSFIGVTKTDDRQHDETGTETSDHHQAMTDIKTETGDHHHHETDIGTEVGNEGVIGNGKIQREEVEEKDYCWNDTAVYNCEAEQEAYRAHVKKLIGSDLDLSSSEDSD